MRSRIIVFVPILAVGIVIAFVVLAMATPAGRAHPGHEDPATPVPEQTADAKVRVNDSSGSDGFHAFCVGQIDVVHASRPMDNTEEATCAAAGVDYQRFALGIDAITIVTRPNAVADCLTIEQLRSLWAPDSRVRTWHDLDPAWPGQEIALYGADPSSSAYHHFARTIVGGETRRDYTSAHDHALVEGMVAEEQALGYASYATFVANREHLKAIAVDAGDGCVAPSRDTIGDGSYAPLSQPLALYVNRASLARPEVQAFMRFTLSTAKSTLADAGYALLDDGEYRANLVALERAIAESEKPAA
jgi:phosphate transport system substrate-binding protein